MRVHRYDPRIERARGDVAPFEQGHVSRRFDRPIAIAIVERRNRLCAQVDGTQLALRRIARDERCRIGRREQRLFTEIVGIGVSRGLSGDDANSDTLRDGVGTVVDLPILKAIGDGVAPLAKHVGKLRSAAQRA